MSETVKIWDPHFHIWDLRDGTRSGHEREQLVVAHGDPLYSATQYEADFLPAAADFEHVGGAWVEALSVCHVGLTGPRYIEQCLAEARWAAGELGPSERSYALVPTVPLEEPDAAAALAAVAAIPNARGIRQIVNHEPSWPRNEILGDLLENPQWRAGFALLREHDLSFDLQLNPTQFEPAAAFLRTAAEVPVIINHLGSPLWADVTEHRERYRRGMVALAACPNTSIKISMLFYTHESWDQQTALTDTIHWIIDTFGIDRCFFASNYPVDVMKGWPADRLYGAFRQLASRYSPAEQQQLFADNAMRVYRVDTRGRAVTSRP